MHPRPTVAGFDYPNRVGNAVDAIDRRLKGNLLDNGAFQIWQRGTSFASGAQQFTADRWAFVRGGGVAGGTFSRQAGSNAQYCARIQRDNGNAALNTLNFAQSIESVNSIPYRSKPLTIGFRARCGANYSASGNLLTYLLASGLGTDESILSGFTSGANIVTGTVALTTSWQPFPIASVSAGAAITQLGLQFSWTPTGTAGAADYVEIEEIQTVFGDYVGEFPYLSFAEEFARCQRFFWKSFPYATAPVQFCGTLLGALCYVVRLAGAQYDGALVIFPTKMRAAPTITFYNPLAANAKWRNNTLAADSGNAATIAVGDSGFFAVNNPQVAGDANPHQILVHATAIADI